MYNRYIPEQASYTQVENGEEKTAEVFHPMGTNPNSRHMTSQTSRPQNAGAAGFRMPSFLTGKDGLSTFLTSLTGNGQKGLSGLLKGLKLENLETGDLLLLLIVLYLLIEGDDLEPVIALGLVLLLGLGSGQENEST
ncbi:MAG: hypothetical protein ACOX7N_05815 [Lawsonibacter sp.]|jgi:hypothetical protein